MPLCMPSRYLHVVSIASEEALVCGFGSALRILVCALCLWKTFRMQGCTSPGTEQPAGMLEAKTGEKRERCRASEKELEAQMWWQSLFCFDSPGVVKEKGETHVE